VIVLILLRRLVDTLIATEKRFMRFVLNKNLIQIEEKFGMKTKWILSFA